MTVLRFLLRTSPGMMAFMAAVALLSGACNAGLIAMVNTALHQSFPYPPGLVWAFVGLGLGRLATSFASQSVSVRFSQASIARLRRDLIRSILPAPLRQLERIGAARLLVTLTDDVYNVTQAMLGMPVISVNLALLAGGAVYLGMLSWKILVGVGALSLFGAVGYRLLIVGAFQKLMLARDEEDKLFSHFRALTEGIKELKLHRNRRDLFLSQNVNRTTESYQRYNVAAENRFIIAQHWSHLLFFTLIGAILFLLPVMSSVSSKTLTGYVITTLYLMGPLAGVLTSFSMFGRANVALDKIQRLGLSLGQHPPEEALHHAADNVLAFQRLELVRVTHSYHNEKDDSHFLLGPVNLRLHPGELVFIVGGNGSGKSTLAKIITGLYPPEAGEIRLDGKRITDKNRDHYRQLFSAVFADFYLFETLLGIERGNLDARAQEYLAELHLDGKVKVRDGRLSTIELSQGQRKRLALLTAYLEDRPFYVFDEWASDQDPQFKNIFYRRLVPELVARGKTVLIITHDDRYFDLADRIIKLDYGQVVADAHQPAQVEPVAVAKS